MAVAGQGFHITWRKVETADRLKYLPRPEDDYEQQMMYCPPASKQGSIQHPAGKQLSMEKLMEKYPSWQCREVQEELRTSIVEQEQASKD